MKITIKAPGESDEDDININCHEISLELCKYPDYVASEFVNSYSLLMGVSKTKKASL